jgi:hypothetical protein
MVKIILNPDSELATPREKLRSCLSGSLTKKYIYIYIIFRVGVAIISVGHYLNAAVCVCLPGGLADGEDEGSQLHSVLHAW